MAYDIFKKTQTSRDWSCGSSMPGTYRRTGPGGKTVWPWVAGIVALVGWLSHISHKGHHEIEARLRREGRL